jgi:hypothetical protein
MILDELTEFADAVTVNTGAPATYNLGDVIDLTVARDIGNGHPIYAAFQVDTAIAGTSSTVAFQIASDSTTTPSVDGSQTIHYTSAAIAEASLVAGYRVGPIALPMGSPDYERYLGAQYTVGTAALSAGAISAFLVLDPAGWKAYPDASN